MSQPDITYFSSCRVDGCWIHQKLIEITSNEIFSTVSGNPDRTLEIELLNFMHLCNIKIKKVGGGVVSLNQKKSSSEIKKLNLNMKLLI